MRVRGRPGDGEALHLVTTDTARNRRQIGDRCRDFDLGERCAGNYERDTQEKK